MRIAVSRGREGRYKYLSNCRLNFEPLPHRCRFGNVSQSLTQRQRLAEKSSLPDGSTARHRHFLYRPRKYHREKNARARGRACERGEDQSCARARAPLALASRSILIRRD